MDQTLKQKIGVLAPSVVNQSFFCLSTVIVQMARTFSEADLSTVQLVFTLPSLTITLASLVAGKLACRFHKKTLLLTGLLMTAVGGTAGFFLSFSLGALLACSAVIGLGVGLNLTLSYAIICDYYTGSERGKLMGLNTSFVCMGGVFFSFLGGALASVAGWSAVYLGFLLLLPVAALVWRWCPPGLLEGQDQRQGRLGLSGYFLLLTGLGFVCYTFQNGFNANSSLYLSELGRYTPALASLSSICNSGGGIIGGLLFGWLLSRLKHQIQSAAYLLSGVGFALLCLLRAMPTVMAGGFVIGFAFALVNAGSSILIADHASPQSRSMLLAIYNAVVNVGASVSPYVVNPLSGLVENSALGRYTVVTVAMLACGVASVCFQAVSHKKTPA